jgi:hypothetical protein
MKGITAYCKPVRGVCPNATACANDEEIAPSDFENVKLNPPRTGDTTCSDSVPPRASDSPQTRGASVPRRVQSAPAEQ